MRRKLNEGLKAKVAVEAIKGDRTLNEVAILFGAEAGRVPLSMLLSSHPHLQREEVEAALSFGVQTVKYKLGPFPIEQELETLRTLRRWVGDRVHIRIDANRRFSAQEAVRVASLLEPIAPEFVEEITYEPHRMVPVGVPLALDESLAQVDPWSDAPSFWHTPVFQVMVLKPSLLGGICVCHRFAEQAKKFQKKVVVTHMFEGPIAAACCAELALMLSVAGGTLLACSVGPLLERWNSPLLYPGYSFRMLGPELLVHPALRWQALAMGGPAYVRS